MALITTSTERKVRLVFTGDPSVELTPEALQRRTETWRLRQVRQVLAALPKEATEEERHKAEQLAKANLADAKLPRVWVGLDECRKSEGATVATVRSLSWHEDQEVNGLPPEQNIRRVLELCVVEIGDSTEAARQFLINPPAHLVTPLYHAIVDHTWGNSPG